MLSNTNLYPATAVRWGWTEGIGGDIDMMGEEVMGELMGEVMRELMGQVIGELMGEVVGEVMDKKDGPGMWTSGSSLGETVQWTSLDESKVKVGLSGDSIENSLPKDKSGPGSPFTGVDESVRILGVSCCRCMNNRV